MAFTIQNLFQLTQRQEALLAVLKEADAVVTDDVVVWVVVLQQDWSR